MDVAVGTLLHFSWLEILRGLSHDRTIEVIVDFF